MYICFTFYLFCFMSKKIKVKVQPRSGFDKSFQNMLTGKVGTLIPLLCDEIIPNTTVSLRSAISASLPPLASDTFMRCQIRCEAFFVPFRLLYGGYQYWQVRQAIGSSPVVPSMPHFALSGTYQSGYDFGPGSLADFLGMKVNGASSLSSNYYSLLPFVAYHRIYDDWYRNKRVQKPLFTPILATNTSDALSVSHLPFTSLNAGSYFVGSEATAAYLNFPDGVNVFSLRQRNFDDDYFTSSFTDAQLGNPQSVSFATDGATGSFSIASLRMANSLQQFLERNNLLGYDLQEYNKGQYGADLSDGVASRSLWLGSCDYDVYSKGIYQAALPTRDSIDTRNPFQGSVGATFGAASAGGDFCLIDNFTANESGYIFVMCSLVPKVTYSSGVDKKFVRYVGSSVDDRGDMANPILQNVGNMPISVGELTSDQSSNERVFGYTDRYADFMTRNDELHGLLRDGQSLQHFALQRRFDVSPESVTLSTNFLQIPTNYLDQVASVAGDISNFGFWLDSWLDYKVIQPLARYSIPSLQNPAVEHGNTVSVNVNGKHV